MRYNLIILVNICIISLVEGCLKTWQRKEIRDLTSTEFDRYIKAVKSLHIGQDTRYWTSMENFTRQHFNAYRDSDPIHNTPQFLIWHRRFIRDYEQELQKYDSRVTLPYWDWSVDANKPHLSKVLTSAYIGGNGDSKDNYNVVNGPFKNFRIDYPKRHYLSRSFDRGSTLSPFATQTELQAILNSKKYSDFAKQVEEVHGDPHVFIGGDYDFGQMTSPNDPLFWLHHSFIELLLAKWQDKNPKVNYEGDAYGHWNANQDDELYGYNGGIYNAWVTGDRSKNARYCYSYSQWPKPKSSDARTATPTNSLTKLLDGLDLDQSVSKLQELQNKFIKLNGTNNNTNGRTIKFIFDPQPIPEITPKPEKWVLMNGMDLNQVRELENKRNTLRKLMNSLPINLPLLN